MNVCLNLLWCSVVCSNWKRFGWFLHGNGFYAILSLVEWYLCMLEIFTQQSSLSFLQLSKIWNVYIWIFNTLIYDMADDIDISVVKKTQELLGTVIKKPVLTEKSLKKPPFRFLHDIITNVCIFSLIFFRADESN